MNKKIILGAVGIVFLGIAYYGISPLFRNTRIDEAVPESKSEEATTGSASTTNATSAGSNEPAEETFAITGTTGHPASGTVRIVNTENGDVVRYENFKTINGPDLYVYLAQDLDAKEFVSLGELKATEGNINYSVPAGVEVSKYRYAMVWCKQFGVAFNYADLTK